MEETKGTSIVEAQTGTQIDAAPQSELAKMWAGLVELSRDSSVDAEKIAALAQVQTAMIEAQKAERDDARAEEFARDKIAALIEMPVIKRDGTIRSKAGDVRARFSTFERLMSVVQPILNNHGMMISFDVSYDDKTPRISSLLSHRNGHVERSGAMAVPIDRPNQTVTMAQAAAMSVTLGKRHVMKATLAIVEEDDDGTGQMIRQRAPEDWEESLINDGQRMATLGLEAYENWFKSQKAQHRGFLVDEGKHNEFKHAASQIDEMKGAS